MSITAGQDALASDFISTSAGTADSGKVPKLDANGKLDVTFGKFGGTGADGALSISSGTTTIDCANAAVVIKNYTSISITSTGKLAFSNPHTNGTIVILRSQGNVTLTSSTSAMVDMSSMGAAGGNGITCSAGTVAGLNGNEPNSNVYLASGRAGFGAANNGGAGNTGAAGTYVTTLVAGLGKYGTPLIVGAGGGSGGDGGGTGLTGAGGRGGGGIIIECAGAWNFTTSGGISVAGGAGGNGASGRGNGAGGGGGFCVVQYNTLTSNSGTITVSGGTGGTGATSSGKTGGGGASQTANGVTGNGNLQTGVNGGDGWSSVSANSNYF